MDRNGAEKDSPKVESFAQVGEARISPSSDKKFCAEHANYGLFHPSNGNYESSYSEERGKTHVDEDCHFAIDVELGRNFGSSKERYWNAQHHVTCSSFAASIWGIAWVCCADLLVEYSDVKYLQVPDPSLETITC